LLINKNKPLILFFYFITFFFFFINNHWFLIWLCLELNSLIFLSLICPNKTSKEVQTTLNYLIIQTITSLILIFGLVNVQIFNISETSSFLFVIIPLLIKITFIPLHNWIYSIIFYIKFFIVFLLFSLQKIMPLMFFLLIKPYLNAILFIILLFSRLIRPILNWSQTSFKRIITFSRISHTCWYFLALLLSEILSFFYFFLYIIISFYVFFFYTNNIKNVKIKNNKFQLIFFLLFLIIVGIPPFLLFYPKILILNILNLNSIIFIFFIFILNSSLDFFIYIQFSYNSLFLKNLKIYWIKRNLKNNINLLLFTLLRLFIWKF